MVSFFMKNAQSIIVAIIFIVIIEMLLPDGANKKYVKIVSGIYIITIILNPFLKLFNKEFDFNFIEELDSIETSSSINININDYYINSLKDAMKAELKEKGFSIQEIEIKLNKDYTEIVQITVKGALSKEHEEILKYLLECYGVENNKVIFL